MNIFKRNWIYKGIGETHTILGTKKYVHVWECSLTNKIKTKNIK